MVYQTLVSCFKLAWRLLRYFLAVLALCVMLAILYRCQMGAPFLKESDEESDNDDGWGEDRPGHQTAFILSYF
ncbi:MAG TPA: hypothetical protein VMR75_01935 [Candidatus Saccharimonadales bacterium]|nr:hypothetical protein [Candidatus Saccharimonadales bacterium]